MGGERVGVPNFLGDCTKDSPGLCSAFSIWCLTVALPAQHKCNPGRSASSAEKRICMWGGQSLFEDGTLHRFEQAGSRTDWTQTLQGRGAELHTAEEGRATLFGKYPTSSHRSQASSQSLGPWSKMCCVAKNWREMFSVNWRGQDFKSLRIPGATNEHAQIPNWLLKSALKLLGLHPIPNSNLAPAA